MKLINKTIWGSINVVLCAITFYLNFYNISGFVRKVIPFIFFFSITIYLLVLVTGDYKKKYKKLAKIKLRENYDPVINL